MNNRKVTPKQLLEQIEKLRNELFVTDVQFQLYVGLRKAAPNYKEEIRAAPLFWDYTMRAHIDMVVLRLCQLYDPYTKTISLPNFVLPIEANRAAQISDDILLDLHVRHFVSEQPRGFQ